MDSISCIKTPIEEDLKAFKHLFDNSLTSSNVLFENVVSHIRQRSGKMMRPMLILLMARLYGKVRPSTLHAAVSLELLHTASLVHDDVVDESAERRGQLSVNAVFNNKVAVLTGDYLLATSLVHAEQTHSFPIIRLVSTLGQDLADGELLQLSNVSNRNFSESVYFDVIRKKTAALFAACTKAAALSQEVSEEEVEKARLLGEYIGICFQIRDDIFDYFNSKEIGKPTGNDMLEGKLTLPALFLLNEKKNSVAEAIAWKVKDGTATSDEISRLIELVKESGGIEYAIQMMNSYRDKAWELLSEWPESDVRTALCAYVDYVAERQK